MEKAGNPAAFEGDPILRVILDWYFKRGGEGVGPWDPSWHGRPVGQISTLVAIHELAGQIVDQKIGKQLQAAAASGIAGIATKLAG